MIRLSQVQVLCSLLLTGFVVSCLILTPWLLFVNLEPTDLLPHSLDFLTLFIYNIYSIYFFNDQLKALLGEWSINVSIIITFEIKFTGTHLSPVDHQSKSYTPQCNQTYTTLLQSLLQHMPSVPRLLRLSLGNYVSHGFQRSMLGSGMLP